MAGNRYLEKAKKGHISAMVLPIGTKFRKMTHISPPNPIDILKFRTLKIQDGRHRHL